MWCRVVPHSLAFPSTNSMLLRTCRRTLQPACTRLMATMDSGKVLTASNINERLKEIEYAVRGPIVTRATELEKELASGVKKPFTEIVKANIGDCHAVGQKPITFIRQVVSACMYPDLIDSAAIYPEDVKARARNILKSLKGSVGCYSDSSGIQFVRENVAKYIMSRDGYPSDPGTIFLTNGASSSVKLILQLFASEREKTGMLVPIPQYPLYSATIMEYGCHLAGYYLNEKDNWKLDIVELKRALDEARKHSNPRILCVINPGNPTGQVLSYDNIKEVIAFCKQEGLFLAADEVYQDNIYGKGLQFHSFKKVLRDLGPDYDGFEMASFHSTSKGYMGECGLRGGYVELVGITSDILAQVTKLQSANLGSNVVGQLVMDCVVNPPQPGDESYDLFQKEKKGVLDSLKERGRMVFEELNKINGVSCNEVMGAMYAFPKLDLPQKAIDKARSLGQEPDFFYCLELLEKTGLCVVPGSGFVQEPGTFHFRMTILPPTEQIKMFIEKFTVFHKNFMAEYGDNHNRPQSVL